ncbi:Glycosyltransferase like family 2 [Geodermatophilus amargosae]|uniref:Glycosyltransferase like family 2 n=1 Tax=Geodermatophilus amargosae TaxID=1296565 RepID=A0A1I7A3J7_9ACTN|nr:glycosyltransferase family 2 protein [Geodermatophilus amargosae]SFT69518.1 Glycosyltransferase like family 2 [Geodermatophilus amargosae]
MTASPTLERLDAADVRAGEPQVHVVALEALGAADAGVALPREPYVTVLVPAHDEGDQIAATLEGLRRQTLRPTRVVVVADNCSDDTVAIARAAGAEVFETVGNTAKKAGALNQAWSLRFRRVAEGDRRDGERRAADRRTVSGTVRGPERRAQDRRADDDRRGPDGDRRSDSTGRPDAADDDLVLVQDADSSLDEGFLEGAATHVRADDRLGAVGGTFRGDPGGGLVGHLQRNEYARYARDVRRLKGKCLVVTGTAAMFRAATLRRISEARLDGRVPRGDGAGGIYDTTVLTEDNELTFAILHLGYQVLSPKECTLTTEVMPTWRALWNQRLRWKRGAIENCVQYGVTRVTWRYWGRQLLTFAGVVVTFLYLGSLAASLLSSGHVKVQPFWLAVTGVFVVERVVTVRDRGWRHMVAAATMYELLYDVFLQLVHAKAYPDAALRRERRW